MVYLSYLGEFLALYAIIYALSVVAYVLACWALLYVNHRNPERRIQQNRRGEKRKSEEIRNSLESMAMNGLTLTIGLYFPYRGWSLVAPAEFSWWTAVPWFVAVMVLFDAWFYFGHRLMHTKKLYKYHELHHKSVAPTVWSTYSDGLIDPLVLQGFYAVMPLILPIPVPVLLAHRVFDHITGAIGHSGFEYFANRTARYPSPMLCTTYHDLHHSKFRYNFAHYFSHWDRLLGTAHPSYDAIVEDYEVHPRPLRLTGPVLDDGMTPPPGATRERPSAAE